MLTENLFEKVLIEPAMQNFDTLCIVSGYASATMVSRHFDHLRRGKREVRIQLIVGMAYLKKTIRDFRNLPANTKMCLSAAMSQAIRLSIQKLMRGAMVTFRGLPLLALQTTHK